MEKITEKIAIEKYGVDTLALLYIAYDTFNNQDHEIKYYRFHDLSPYGFDISKKVVEDDEEEFIMLYTEVDENDLKIAKAIINGKIRKAAYLCKKYNLALNISELLNNNLFVDEERRITLKELFGIK